MTKRLSVGVLLFAIAAFVFAVTVNAERLSPREWNDKSDPYRALPLFFRSSAGTTWVQVNSTGGCDPALVSAGGDIHDNTDHTAADVFCFEGPDSLWPAGPSGMRFDEWTHFPRNLPPYEQPSRWHISNYYRDIPQNGSFIAWCGCDSIGTNPACTDVAFWVNQEGYANEWQETMQMDASLYGAQSGGTLTFSLRYDTECVYDYLFLEYFNPNSGPNGAWELMTDSLDVGQNQAGTAAVFNGVSGNPEPTDICDNGPNNGDGGPADGNYFNTGTRNPGGPGPYHGNAVWYHSVQFPIPSGIDFVYRFRGSSDPAWSDEDGRGDTDGIGQVDNVIVAFANGDSLVDRFEFGDFVHVREGEAGAVADGSAQWSFGTAGNSYDGWHLEFDPRYKNRGNTCTFSNDWMWAAKPPTTAIPSSESGFEFFLAAPTMPCDGWTGGTCIWSQYMCMPDERDDYTNTYLRWYDSSVGAWAPWNDFDGFVIFAGCEFWNVNSAEDLTPFLGTNVDSLQMGWLVLDASQPGEFSWGKHGAVTYLIDNVVFGSFDGSGTIFTARGIDIFADTFSRADPAHTPFLQNPEQGLWPGRPFAKADSLSVQITDNDGMDTVNGSATVNLWWRVDTGTGGTFGAWNQKPMHLSEQSPSRPDGEGTYRIIIGDDSGTAPEDQTGAVDGLIWNAGQTVEYYVLVMDDLGQTATWPAAASESPPTYFEFSILPFDWNTQGGIANTHVNGRPVDTNNPNAKYILLVDDYTRNALDFAASAATGSYDPTGGAGFGNFDDAVVDQPEDMVERALGMLYGPMGWTEDDPPRWDKYDVQGAGSSVQDEPRGVSDVGNGLGAYLTDDQNVIYYDAIIWLQGTFDGYSYADTTRLELGTYLRAGGKFYNSGDQVAFHLGSGGNDADSLIGFMADYLGMSFTAANHEVTTDRKLNIQGLPGRSLSGVTLGLYGECPFRRTFDDVGLSNPGVTATPDSIAIYTAGAASDNNRLAMVKCSQTVGGGVAVSDCFGLEVLLSDESRACLLGRVFSIDFGLPVNNAFACINNGDDAPVIAAGGFGFDLAAARPNPFREATAIKFSVPAKTHVSIEVFNILGQKVRTLVNENLEANSYVRDWDGRADDGQAVSSGIYFYRMVAGDFSATKKAVLLK